MTQLKISKVDIYKKLFYWNVRIHGYNALLYGHTLGDTRYIAYLVALDVVGRSAPNDLVLDIGCGHSILPSMFLSKTNIVVIDINPQALRWQVSVGNKVGGKSSIYPVLASANKLPFKSEIFSYVVSISAFEHFPQNIDIEACQEVNRTLKGGGECLITVTASESKTKIKTDWTTGIPLLFVKIFGPILPLFFKKWKIADRGGSYFERFYSIEDLLKRFVKPTKLKLEELSIIKRKQKLGRLVQSVRKILVPFGLISAIECICAKTLVISKDLSNTNNAISFIIKLKKAHAY